MVVQDAKNTVWMFRDTALEDYTEESMEPIPRALEIDLWPLVHNWRGMCVLLMCIPL